MKNKFSFSKSLFFLCLVLLTSTKVLAAQTDYEEVSYDDLVQQLHQKKSSYNNFDSSGFDSILIHAGVGLVTSATNVRIQDSSSYRYQNGLQLSLGIDLFSPQWQSEAVLRNFGQSSSGTESRSLREFDLNVLYKTQFDRGVGLRVGAGLGTRYFKMTDELRNIYVSDTTPTALFITGVDVYATKKLSFGIEGALRSSMVNDTTDRSAVDLSLRMDTHF